MDRLEPIVEQVRQMILEKLAVRMPHAQFQATTPLFAGGLELNSFAVVELIGLLENRFGFQFEEADFREETFRDVQSLAKLVERYQSMAARPSASP